MITAPELGLRERKKVATRQALHEAAVRLAIEHGAGKITVEAVADEAGVSRRTFSNYFANKEEALLYGDRLRMGTLIEVVRSRPPGEAPWAALSRSAEELYGKIGDLDPHWVAQTRLLRTEPSLLALQVSTFATLEEELAGALADRLAADDAPAMRARLMAATYMTAMRVALHLWLERPDETPLPELARRTLVEVGRGFA
ncbi:TetR/AcrR family transcriptional regulator [Actinoplanes sp. TFC3]|uniref:TetR/AcrR family transcriptional regulator n=1 Tax=Actinoplanes sp. TFC3 TaxID=1710355 RepID=UPI0008314C49|nr:TetR/AcrR family transcriptional regulator [Actinoplanes sp. TFC3]